MTEPDPDADPTLPRAIETDRYGASADATPIPPRSDSWSSAPAWSTRRSLPTEPPLPEPARRPRLIGFVAIALAAGLVSGSLSGLAVVNLVGGQPPGTTTLPPGEQVQQLTLDETSAITNAVASVAPAVVTIEATQTTGGTGSGSGFIFDPDGWILTNKHVAEGAATLTVTLADSRTFDASLIGTDTLTDLAIIKIDASELPTAPIGSSAALEIGQLAVAIGNPLGTYRDTVTTGVVSGLGRQIVAGDGASSEQLNHLIQTDAAINPGNSGGPLLDSAGQAIGVNTAVNQDAQGIGFAIPIDVAKPIINQALNGQELERPWIGVYYVAITKQLATDRDLPVDSGVLIDSSQSSVPAVFPGSPAERAGLRSGDIITAIDGNAVNADQDLAEQILQKSPGDTVTLRVLRSGSTREVEVKLGVLPAQN